MRSNNGGNNKVVPHGYSNDDEESLAAAMQFHDARKKLVLENPHHSDSDPDSDDPAEYKKPSAPSLPLAPAAEMKMTPAQAQEEAELQQAIKDSKQAETERLQRAAARQAEEDEFQRTLRLSAEEEEKAQRDRDAADQALLLQGQQLSKLSKEAIIKEINFLDRTIQGQIFELIDATNVIIRSDDYKYYLGHLSSPPLNKLAHLQQDAMDTLKAAHTKALTIIDHMAEQKMSLKDNDPLVLFAAEQKAFLKNKLDGSIATRRTTAEAHLATLNKIEGVEENHKQRQLALKTLCQSVQNRAGLKTLDDHNKQLEKAIEAAKVQAKADRESYIEAGRVMLQALRKQNVKDITTHEFFFKTCITDDTRAFSAKLTRHFVEEYMPAYQGKEILVATAENLLGQWTHKIYDHSTHMIRDNFNQVIEKNNKVIQAYIEKLEKLLETNKLYAEGLTIRRFSGATEHLHMCAAPYSSAEEINQYFEAVNKELPSMKLERQEKEKAENARKARLEIMNQYAPAIAKEMKTLASVVCLLISAKAKQTFTNEYVSLEQSNFTHIETDALADAMHAHLQAVQAATAQASEAHAAILRAQEANKQLEDQEALAKKEEECKATIESTLNLAYTLITEKAGIVQQDFKQITTERCTRELNQIIHAQYVDPRYKLQALANFCRQMREDIDKTAWEKRNAARAEKAAEEALAAKAAKQATDAKEKEALILAEIETAAQEARTLIKATVAPELQAVMEEQLTALENDKQTSTDEKLVSVNAFTKNLKSITQLNETEAAEAAAVAALETKDTESTFVSGAYRLTIHGRNRNAFFAPFNEAHPLDGLDALDNAEVATKDATRRQEIEELRLRKRALIKGALGKDTEKQTAEYAQLITDQKKSRAPGR